MSPAEHLAHLFAAVEQLPAIREELERAARALHAQATAGAMLAALEDGLHPDHGYTLAQAGAFLGMKAESVGAVSPILLPRFGKGRVLGIDVMAYRGDVTREEAEAYKGAKRALVERALQRAA